jgi:hypothetical protein
MILHTLVQAARNLDLKDRVTLALSIISITVTCFIAWETLRVYGTVTQVIYSFNIDSNEIGDGNKRYWRLTNAPFDVGVYNVGNRSVVLEKIFAVVQLTKLTRQNGALASVIQPVANISCAGERKRHGMDEDDTLFDVVESKGETKGGGRAFDSAVIENGKIRVFHLNLIRAENLKSTMAIKKVLLRKSEDTIDGLLCLDFRYSDSSGTIKDVYVPTFLIRALYNEGDDSLSIETGPPFHFKRAASQVY